MTRLLTTLLAALLISSAQFGIEPLAEGTTPNCAALSTQLYGDGTSNAKNLLDAWALSYSYVRDDVSLSYAGSGTEAALTAYTKQTVDFVGTDRGVTGDLAAVFGTLLQFPLFGQAMVVTYNIAGLDPAADPYLILDRETLGLIWAGEITQWNDTRIQALNPPAVSAKLPAATITLGYSINNGLSFAEVFKVALSSFSATFRTALAAANDSYALLPPALAGHATDAGRTTALRVAWLKSNTNSMTFVRHDDCLKSGLPWANMVNKAGKVVAPSVYSVQAAMAEFAAHFSAGNLTIDIVDAPGNESWPLAYTTFIAINRSITALDCTNIEELMHFIAWTQINDGASALATSSGSVPIDESLRKNVLDLLTHVQCNGERALAASYLIGAGPPLPVYTAWTVAQSTTAATIKYFEAASSQAKQQLLTFDEQFGATSNGLEAEWYSAIPDVALVPATIYAIVPAFHLRELDGLELVLDFDTIAAIYLAEVTQWNDARIKAINSPVVANALPAKPIVVVTQTTSSAITHLFTTMLSAQVAAFAAQVGASDVVTFPVQASGNQSIDVDNYTALVAALAASDGGFSFINNYDAVLTRTLDLASMNNTAGVVVRANATTVQSALSNYLAANANPDYTGIILSAGAESWPLATFGAFFYRSKTMEDCSKAEALASFLYYTQTDPQAKSTASRQGFIQASADAGLQRRFLNQLKEFTCGGVAVSSLYGCINDGRLCSDAGACAHNSCVCDSGRDGQYCESFASASSSSDASTITIAVVVPVAAAVLLVLVCFIVVLVVLIKRRGNKSDDWEIEYSELEVGETLGAGGYGEVHKAVWKGTEVAVKVIAAEKITKDMEKSFQDEVRVMTSLRHPNVVLFMAASTKPPKMCIVMEFMALGSLYDLLHNELVPEIPFQLKAKMAYQASKGMHFLHSSGIVHRDLKSLNLLLDNKWNVKVSDFGLTKFKEDVKKGGSAQNIAGSVHWTAPEVLNESSDVDFILADVYSFGIILWELLSREQPYFGMSPAAVAVAVIRDGIRPRMPDEVTSCPAEYEELVTSCWHSDPVIRPTFLEIMTRLSAMHGDSASGGGGTSFTSKTTTSSSSSGGEPRRPKNTTSIYGSWTLPSTHGSATSTGSSSSSSSSNASRNFSAAQVAAGGVRAQEGEVAIVFTDITRAASLWEFNAAAMRDATLLHNDALRAALKRHRGYEVVFLRDRNSGEGSFCMAFQHAADALAWCADVQQALLAVEWPEALLDHPGAAEEWGDTDDRVIYKGLRVRMGVHVGTPKVVRDPMTRRVEYIGPVVNAAARITAMTHGGQIVMSHAAHDKVVGAAAAAATPGDDAPTSPAASASAATFASRVVSLGKFEMPDVPHGARLYELKVEGLEGRFFGGVTKDGDTTSSSGAPSSGTSDGGHGKEQRSDASCTTSGSGDGRGGGGSGDMQTAVGEGMMFKEDTFLTSANLCRWIIDFGEIQVGKQVGLGSYGVVFRGKWKGVEVAVKRFIKQKLDERRMLEFRAEMAFLSELHHPNIVLFIGACVKKPNLCIVTEFMKLGSLRDILGNNAVKLAWKQKLRLLRSAALGLNYLHSLHPVIVHRDVKPSNLLVDENWNVKVADFGFARIKEENATMTRCGTPCWTAPEIIRGEKYDERADVFSFGVVMWQVVTRREPYAGRNFMGVSLDVLEGKRPQIPGDCPPEFRRVMKKCWHANADKRPRMEDVVAFLDRQVGDDGDVAAPSLTMPV